MAKWIEYTGSDEQITEMHNSDNGWLVIFYDGTQSDIHKGYPGKSVNMHAIQKYLICEPHPYADLIKIWADTGCPVWYRFKAIEFEPGIETEEPDWFNDKLEFNLTPFGD